MGIAALNTHSQDIIAYTDNRSPDVIFTTPGAFENLDLVYTTRSFPVQKSKEIYEIINPASANVSFEIDVSAVVGATVAWSTVPSGCTVTNVGGVYTIDGIDSVDVWDIVKAPTITVPSTFNGSFFYYAAIRYTTSAGATAQTWQVGIFIPEAYLQAAFTQTATGGPVRLMAATLTAQASVYIDADELQLKETSASLTATASATATGAIIDVILSPASGAMTYSTNVNFYISNAPTIVSNPTAANDRYLVRITPSTTAAITTITPDDVSASNDYTLQLSPDAIGRSNSIGGIDQVATSEDYTVIADPNYSDSNAEYRGRVIQVDNSTGTITRSYLGGATDFSYFGSGHVSATPSYVYIADTGVLYNASTGASIRAYPNTYSTGMATETYTIVRTFTGSTLEVRVYLNSNGSLVRTYTDSNGTSSGFGSDIKIVGRHAIIYSTKTVVSGSTSTIFTYYEVYDIVDNVKLYQKSFSWDSTAASKQAGDIIEGNSTWFALRDASNIYVYDVITGNIGQTLNVSVTGTDIALTDRYVAHSYNNQIKFYDIRTGNLMETITGTDNTLEGVTAYLDRFSVCSVTSGTPTTTLYHYTIDGSQLWTNYSGNRLTLVGSKESYNNTINDFLEVDPTTSFSSNYTLSYTAENADGFAGLERIQNVNNV